MKNFIYLIIILVISICGCEKIKTKEGQNNWKKYKYDDIDLKEKEREDFYSISINDIFFINKDVGYIAGDNCYNISCTGVIYKTDDGGKTWSTKYTNSMEAGVFAIFFVSDNIGYASGVNNATPFALKTIDGGNNWFFIGEVGYASNYFNSIFFINKDIGFIGGSKTIDGGNTWSNMIIDDISSIYFPDNIHGYAVSSGWYFDNYTGVIYKTTDTGDNWDSIYSEPNSNFTAVYFLDSLTGFVGGSNLLKTTNGGKTWKVVNSNSHINDIVFIDKNIGFAASSLFEYGGNGSGYILKTTNGGDTWEINYESSIVSFHCINFPTEDIGYAGGYQGFKPKLKHAYFAKTTTQGE